MTQLREREIGIQHAMHTAAMTAAQHRAETAEKQRDGEEREKKKKLRYLDTYFGHRWMLEK